MTVFSFCLWVFTLSFKSLLVVVGVFLSARLLQRESCCFIQCLVKQSAIDIVGLPLVSSHAALYLQTPELYSQLFIFYFLSAANIQKPFDYIYNGLRDILAIVFFLDSISEKDPCRFLSLKPQFLLIIFVPNEKQLLICFLSQSCIKSKLFAGPLQLLLLVEWFPKSHSMTFLFTVVCFACLCSSIWSFLF